MKHFSILKNIRKGIEGAILSGAAVEAAVQVMQQAEDVDLSDVEHAVTVIVAAGIGFLFKSVKNWLKNRDK